MTPAPTHTPPDNLDISCTDTASSSAAPDDISDRIRTLVPNSALTHTPAITISLKSLPADTFLTFPTHSILLALIVKFVHDCPNAHSRRIITQPRKSEKRHHTASRILKAAVGGVLTTPVLLAIQPNAAHLPQFSAYDIISKLVKVQGLERCDVHRLLCGYFD